MQKIWKIPRKLLVSSPCGKAKEIKVFCELRIAAGEEVRERRKERGGKGRGGSRRGRGGGRGWRGGLHVQSRSVDRKAGDTAFFLYFFIPVGRHRSLWV